MERKNKSLFLHSSIERMDGKNINNKIKSLFLHSSIERIDGKKITFFALNEWMEENKIK
jgi:hypothetical protein